MGWGEVGEEREGVGWSKKGTLFSFGKGGHALEMLAEYTAPADCSRRFGAFMICSVCLYWSDRWNGGYRVGDGLRMGGIVRAGNRWWGVSDVSSVVSR